MAKKLLLKKPLRYVDNGIYQKILYLGAAGWVIINKMDKEILLIDPWPSFSKTSRNKKSKTGMERINKFVLWLREKVAEHYKLTGILAGHEHYDHIDDIPWILSILADKSITTSPPCSPEQLPCIYCDSGSKEKLEKSNSPHMKFCEILDGNNKLFYDDIKIRKLVKKKKPGYPLTAGKAVNTMQIGHFIVTPYIWDHSNTVISNTTCFLTPLSGHYQRTSAFLIMRRQDDDTLERPKTTFIIGSGGEMCPKYTSNVCDTKIDSDLLLQAVAAKAITTTFSYKKHLSKMVEYQVRNIKTKMIISSHFENFVYRITGPGKLEQRAQIVKDYVEELEKKFVSTGQEIPDVNIMERLCFEYDPEDIVL